MFICIFERYFYISSSFFPFFLLFILFCSIFLIILFLFFFSFLLFILFCSVILIILFLFFFTFFLFILFYSRVSDIHFIFLCFFSNLFSLFLESPLLDNLKTSYIYGCIILYYPKYFQSAFSIPDFTSLIFSLLSLVSCLFCHE